MRQKIRNIVVALLVFIIIFNNFELRAFSQSG